MAGILQIPVSTAGATLVWSARSDTTVNTLLLINQDLDNTVYIGQDQTITVGGQNTIPLPPNGSLSVDPSSAWYVIGAVQGISPLVMVPNGQATFRALTQGEGKLAVPSIQSPDFQQNPLTGWSIDQDGNAYFESVTIGGGVVRVTFSAIMPANPNTGDVWFDLANGARPGTWNGAQWVTYQWGQQAIGNNAIGTNQIANNAVGTNQIANAAVTPAQISALTASLIGQTGGVLNSNPFLTGGDLTGYSVYNGTLSIVSGGALPVGAPAAYAGLWTQTGQWGYPYQVILLPGSTNPYQILVTMWVNSASATVWNKITPATNGVNGADIWKPHTVTPNTWTQISDVVTIPAGATSASIGPSLNSATSGTVYFWGMTVTPQMPGALIQAGTVTAAQIAAGTVTAAQIKAGTITAALLAAGIVVAGIVDSTTINAATFNGSIFNGLDFTIDSAGIFFYSGTPASGNLVMALTNSSGNDPYGNAYNAGFSSLAANGARINIEPAGGVSALNMLAANMVHNVAAPQIVGGSVSPGLANEICQLAMSSGKETNIALPDSEIILSTGAADGSSNPNIALQFGGNPVLTADQAEVSVAVPVVADTWHTMTLAGGWTVGSGGRARYRLGIENRVFVDVSGIVPGTTTDGTVIWVPAVGYSPLAGASQVLTADVQYVAAPAYGSGPSVKVGSGGILVENLRGTIASISFSGSYALD